MSSSRETPSMCYMTRRLCSDMCVCVCVTHEHDTFTCTYAHSDEHLKQ